MDDDDKLALKHAHPADRAAYKRGYFWKMYINQHRGPIENNLKRN
jgi:hypothetical protein